MLTLAALLLAAAPAQSVDVNGTLVTFTPALTDVDHPIRVPVHITATSVAPRSENVEVSICASWRCSVRRTVTVRVNGPGVDVEAPLWPQGLQARITNAAIVGNCCGTPRRPAHVVARTGSFASARQLTQGNNGAVEGGVTELGVGDTLRTHPALLDGVSAVIVDKPGDVDKDALYAWVERGGVASVDPSLFPGSSGNTLAALADEPRALSLEGAVVEHVAVPSGTLVARRGAGLLVVRTTPLAVDDGLGAVLAARPELLTWIDSSSVDDLSAVRAAAVALDVRPPRSIAFPIALLAVIGVVVVMARGRRRGDNAAGWQRALAQCALLAVSASASLWLLQWATIPAEQRARVVTWTGPDASWETGVDAVRPRGTARVEVHSDVPFVGVTLVGARNTPAADADFDVDTHAASAVVRSNAGLAGVWTRPSPHPRAVHVDGAGNDAVLHNDLDVPLLAVLLDEGRLVTREPVAARGSVALGSPAMQARMVYERPAAPHISVVEERLLNEVLHQCSRARAQNGTECGAAVARLDDGTLLGVEVVR